MVGTLCFAHPTHPTNSTFRSPSLNSLKPRFRPDCLDGQFLGDGILIVSTAAAQRRALFILALTVLIGASRFISESWAAGALAVGKCGAYGQAYDYAAEAP